MQQIRSKVTGMGCYLPEKILTNSDLERMVETSDEWIKERTGIVERRIAAPNEQTSDLALQASRIALSRAGLEAADIDGIIVATATPDQTLPQTSCILQNKLGAHRAMAMDVAAACSGFTYALTIADSFIKCQGLKHVLVVGAETLSRIVNYKDRETCILFGDGAGAFVLSRSQDAESRGVLACYLKSDGTQGDLLTIEDSKPTDPFGNIEVLPRSFIKMRGKEIFKNAVRALSEASQQALMKAQVKIEEVDWFIPHQANLRIMTSTAQLLGVPLEKVVNTIAETGNTSSASIPIALTKHFEAGRLVPGNKVLMTAFGAGLTSGAVVIEF